MTGFMERLVVMIMISIVLVLLFLWVACVLYLASSILSPVAAIAVFLVGFLASQIPVAWRRFKAWDRGFFHTENKDPEDDDG